MSVLKAVVTSPTTSAAIQRHQDAETSVDGTSGPDYSDFRVLPAYEAVKYCIDVPLSMLLVAVALPLMLAIALGVKLTSRGPVIYRQPRLTKGGRVFTMYKFRTMYLNAEAASGPIWAKTRDPRVTPLGRLLRTTRLDELPQLFNVILGHMSLIGPRPERPELVRQLSKKIPNFEQRMAVKAGITGLAQVSNGYASSISSYRRKVRLDLHYVNNYSLLLDFVIALKTIKVVCTGFGAK